MGALIRVASVAALSLLLSAPPACSFVVDTSGDQCRSNADCTSRGGRFTGSVCTRERICLTTCTTNMGCAAALGEPAICLRDTAKCAPLLSTDCRTILQEPGALEKDNAVVLGVLLDQTGDNAASDLPRVNAIELARQHIHKANAGLPAIDGGASRPLVIVSCSDADDPIRAAKHLAEVVRVPAIIGPAFSGVTTTVAKEVTIPRGVLLISPSATSPSLTDLADNGLVWRTAPSDVLQAAAMIQLVSKRLEAEVRTAYTLDDAVDIRLAVVHKGDTYGAGLGNALFKGLRFNRGRTPAANEAVYKQIDYGDPLKMTAEQAAASYKSAVDQMVAFKPHILITVGTAEAANEIFASVEGRWTDTGMRPRHVLADGVQVPELLQKIGANEGLRRRVLGTIGASSGATYDDFVNEYKLAFGSATQPDSYAAGAYDATLLLAYAIAGAGNKPLVGGLINEGLKRTAVFGATQIEAGYQQVNTAFKAMAGRGIDYNGASGPLDFNPESGEAEADIQIWCARSAGGTASSFVGSGLTFSAKTKQLEGTFSCW